MAKCWLCNHEWSAPQQHQGIGITDCPNCGQINNTDPPLSALNNQPDRPQSRKATKRHKKRSPPSQ